MLCGNSYERKWLTIFIDLVRVKYSVFSEITIKDKWYSSQVDLIWSVIENQRGLNIYFVIL